MTSWRDALRKALSSGSCASLTSTAVLLWRGRIDCDSAVAPVNATSHWVWGDAALRQNRPSWRHTALGFGIHHAMSIMWATHYEKWRGGGDRLAVHVMPTVAAAVAVSAAACAVDLRCTPRRLTPGFERRLSGCSLAAVYGAFAIGLLLCGARRR